MDKMPFEKENDSDALLEDKLINDLSHKEESLSEISELASTALVMPGDILGKSTDSSHEASGSSNTKAADTAVSVPICHWFVTLMCMNIPIIGWIYLIILACSRSKGPRRDFAKAYLLYKLVFLLLSLAILAVALHYGLELLDQVLAYMEML